MTAARRITVCEFETLPVLDARVDARQRALSQQEADQLLRFEKSLGIRAFEHRYRSIRFLNYCGVFQFGQLTVEVLPKIAKATDDGQRWRLNRELLLRMLAVAHHLQLIDAKRADVELQNHHLLEIIVAHFCHETFRQLQKGVIRQYLIKEEMLPLIRGHWRVEADLRLNAGRKDQPHCQFDDFAEDNSYNQAIKATVRLLIPHTTANSQLNQRLRALAAMLPDVTDREFTAAEVHSFPRSRLISRYETVFQLCEWFLAGQSPNVHAGEERAFGLLFDMNILFQEFVARIFSSVLPAEYRLKTQEPRTFLVRDRSTGDDLFQMKPDMSVLAPNDAVVAIIDTKWKLLDELDPSKKYGVAQSDVYQIAAYAEAYRCDQVALLYPASLLAKNGTRIFNFLKSGGKSSDKNLAISIIELQPEVPSREWQQHWRMQLQTLQASMLGEQSGGA